MCQHSITRRARHLNQHRPPRLFPSLSYSEALWRGRVGYGFARVQPMVLQYLNPKPKTNGTANGFRISKSPRGQLLHLLLHAKAHNSDESRKV